MDGISRKGPGSLLRKICNYETVSYLIIGVLTTVVDYIVFIIVNEALKNRGMPSETTALIATAVSWAAAVLFAYVTNKLIVFRNYNIRPSYLVKECASFFAARGISGLITLLLMWMMTGYLGLWEYIAKVITSIFNMIFNYIASKLFIFKNKG